ncbi:MAG: 16S rRNA (guanine(966)-N(2))-methyltransferase RsmD [Gammaproteobacteria bacterium]|nr:16S rRNA (guanine(966)-N(2))-methyltransferase RsmD [Gammaproteobacteria bacterium]MDP6097401.1 16S rRNA (guanine(966)-N(2))-methyltransferase RsmD [Gammaproteobacteria bacterium]
MQNSKVRIIGGKWRSRKLQFPVVSGLRPTADRIRETFFNWLQEEIPGQTCLDLFAGSGACGFEALSRGAKRVLFIENNELAYDALGANIDLLHAEGAERLCIDFADWLDRQSNQYQNCFGIVFIDPPFTMDLISSVCHLLEQKNILKTTTKIVIESDRILVENELPDSWKPLKAKKSGSVYYYLYEKGSQA